MTATSYSQNFEDIVLNRVYSQEKNGFYIDVGAGDPIAYSNTALFYNRGWRGINIEPSSKYFPKLEEKRPRDINLNIAISNQVGEIEFLELEEPWLSTVNVEEGRKLATRRGLTSSIRTVKCKTLDQIVSEYSIEYVSFLKIDVEGHENEVIEGFSFLVRPKILVIEALSPLTQHDLVPSPWKTILMNRDYICCHFDGLNEWYIPAELDAEYGDLIRFPINYFDDFRLFSDHYLCQNTIFQRDYLKKKIERDRRKREL